MQVLEAVLGRHHQTFDKIRTVLLQESLGRSPGVELLRLDGVGMEHTIPSRHDIMLYALHAG